MSRYFNDQIPVIPHLSKGEVADLRGDVSVGLRRVETEANGGPAASGNETLFESRSGAVLSVDRRIARKDYNLIITVDPVNGNDDPDNDGTVTPLQTLAECLKRLPVVARNVDVLLKAGTHYWPDKGENWAEPISSVTFRGEVQQAETFIVDAVSADYAVVSKAAEEDPWVEGALVGKFVRIMVDFGYPELVPYLYPIIANGTHNITVVWNDQFCYDPDFEAGAEAEIVELATVVRPAPGAPYARIVGPCQGTQFKNIHFEDWLAVLQPQFNGSAQVFESIFSGSTGNFGAIGANYSAGQLSLMSCLIMDEVGNTGNACYLQAGGVVRLVCCGILNAKYGVKAEGIQSSIVIRGPLFAVNVSHGLVLLDQGAKGSLEYTMDLYADNVPVAFMAQGGESSFVIPRDINILDGKAPTTNLVKVLSGAKVAVTSALTAEAAAAATTFHVAGDDLSLEDFQVTNSGDYEGTNRTILTEF